MSAWCTKLRAGRLRLPAFAGPEPNPAVRAVTKRFAPGPAAAAQGHDHHGRDRFALVAFEHHRPLHHVGAVLHALDRGFRFTIWHVGPYSAASFNAGLSTASRNTAVLFAVSGMTGKWNWHCGHGSASVSCSRCRSNVL